MRFFHFSLFHSSRRASPQALGLLSLGALCGAVLLTGCGGSDSSSNNSNSAEIRAVNTISNGGNGTASVSGASVGSAQGYFGATSYQPMSVGISPVTFTLSANSGVTYPSVTQAVTQDFLVRNYYSLILVGRADITTPTDARYPSVIVTADTFTTLSSAQAGLRVIHAAPDAGSIDVLVNGAVIASGAAYKSVHPVVSESAGSVTIQVNQAGTNTILVAPQTITVTGGHVVTVYVVEPTVAPAPAYGLQETDDTASAS